MIEVLTQLGYFITGNFLTVLITKVTKGDHQQSKKKKKKFRL